VAQKIETAKNEAQWFESVRRNTLFIFLFGFFGVAFFLMGLFSYGAGFPPWITGIVSHQEIGFGYLLSAALGLPMSWCLWIGAGVLSVLWLHEHRKNLGAFKEWMLEHFILAGIAFILLFALFGWWFF
jgi:hypothetical protein